jgi:hypothetical protein
MEHEFECEKFIKDNTTKAIPYILIIIAFVVMIWGIYGLVNVQFQ